MLRQSCENSFEMITVGFPAKTAIVIVRKFRIVCSPHAGKVLERELILALGRYNNSAYV